VRKLSDSFRVSAKTDFPFRYFGLATGNSQEPQLNMSNSGTVTAVSRGCISVSLQIWLVWRQKPFNEKQISS